MIVVLNNADGNFLFRMGENTAVILDPKSAPTTATKPIGTGPYKFDNWAKGSSVTLVKNDGYRNAAKVKMKKVTFRFINDPAAQVAALLAGDIDGIPRFGSPQTPEAVPERPALHGRRRRHRGQDDHRRSTTRRSRSTTCACAARIAAAIDRKAVIDGAQEGYGAPIGSHMVPSDAGYVDLTGVNPYNPEKAKALLKEAGVADAAERDADAAAAAYARQGGEIIAVAARQGRHRRRRSRTSNGRSGSRARSRATST